VPVIFGEEVIALIYLYKTDPSARPFDNQDLQLAIAISHQAALTIQRTRLLKQIQDQQRGRQLLERFLSPQEAAYVLNEYLHIGSLPGLDERKATILFTDIADSTGLAERLGARKFGQILNRYYNDVTEIVFAQCGLVKYSGDGIMAVFGMEEPHPYPEERAVKAGMEIVQLAKEGKISQEAKVYLGVSINSGIVVGGYTGNQDRVEFSVLGDVVNVAFRMQQRARPNRLLIGELTAKALGGKYELRDMDPILVKGRTHPIDIYEVLGERRPSKEG
jgi:adenylate cyclase